jgi:hypothetical protein
MVQQEGVLAAWHRPADESTARTGFEELKTLSRVAVVVHERRGIWAAQLRARLQDLAVRWFETRSTADLGAVLLGVSCPVVLIDLRNNAADGIHALGEVTRWSPAARVLLLDPEKNDGVQLLALELGATLVISGFVPPPEVANLIERWISLAATQTEREGWTRPMNIEMPLDAESWLEFARLGGEESPGDQASILG